MKHKLKPMKEASFRDLYRTFLFIKCPDMLKGISDTFELSDGDDGVFALGYVDYQAGLTFRVIAPAHFDGDKIVIGKQKPDVMFMFRADSVQDCTYVSFEPDEMDYVPYYDYIEVAQSYEKDLDEVVEMRQIDVLDQFRHPFFPDDVEIFFVGEKIQPENMWLRLTKIKDKTLYGKLLDEPNQDVGFHVGDEMDFIIARQPDDSIVAVHIVK